MRLRVHAVGELTSIKIDSSTGYDQDLVSRIDLEGIRRKASLVEVGRTRDIDLRSGMPNLCSARVVRHTMNLVRMSE